MDYKKIYRAFKNIALKYMPKSKKKETINEIDICYKVLKKRASSKIMIDVGAHHGGSFAPFLQSNWKVIAIEPDPNSFELLNSNFGNSPNLDVFEVALSDKNIEKAQFFQSKESSGISGLSSFHQSHHAAGTVKVTTLKDLLDRNWLQDGIDFLKIDAEGYDLLVLKGYPWNFSLPRLIVCEFENKKTNPLGYDYHDLAGFLLNKGYEVLVSEWYPIKKYGGQHKWREFSKYPSELKIPNAWGNLIAASEPSMFESLKSEAEKISGGKVC